MADATLLPCDFCGESDFEFHNLAADSADMTPWFVLCYHCEACGPRSETRDGAIELWNTRQPQLPSDDGLIKALETVVSQLEAQNCSTWGLDAGEIQLLDAAREALSRHKAPLSVARGSLTLDNASVQRLFDYGLLNFTDGKWEVARSQSNKVSKPL